MTNRMMDATPFRDWLRAKRVGSGHIATCARVLFRYVENSTTSGHPKHIRFKLAEELRLGRIDHDRYVTLLEMLSDCVAEKHVETYVPEPPLQGWDVIGEGCLRKKMHIDI